MADNKEDVKKKGDELYELAWNFKLMLRTAFPDGIAVSQIEIQYEEYVGQKLDFDTFKSKKYQDWADLFAKCSVLTDTFFLSKRAGEQVVRIRPSNISYTKNDIRRVIQLGCYREHKRRLGTEFEEKPKPVIEELKPNVIDGSTQVETPTTDADTQTDSSNPCLTLAIIPQQLPPLPHHSLTSVPTQVVRQPTVTPTAAAASEVQLTHTPTTTTIHDTAAQDLCTGRSTVVVFEPADKQSVSTQTLPPDGRSDKRRDTEISGEESGPKRNDALQSASTSCSFGRCESVPIFNEDIEKRIPQPASEGVRKNPEFRFTFTTLNVKRSIPMDDPKCDGASKKQKVQEQEGNGAATVTAPCNRNLSRLSRFTPTSPQLGNNPIPSWSPCLGFSSTSAMPPPSSESEGILQSKFLQELDKQVEADLQHLSALSGTSRKMPKPPPAPKLSSYSAPPPSSAPFLNVELNDSILKQFDQQPNGIKSSFLCGCIDMLRGASLFDLPLSELKSTHSNASREKKFNTRDWCAYLIQDRTPHRTAETGVTRTAARQLRGFYLAEEKMTYFLTERGWILDAHLQLPPLTLVYGEFVTRKDKRDGREDRAFEIIDVGYLNGEDLSQYGVGRRRHKVRAFFRDYPSMSVEVKVKDFVFLCNVEKSLTSMWIRNKQATMEEGAYCSTVTGVQIIQVKNPVGYKQPPVFGFSKTIRKRYLLTWPPISDTSDFPGPNIMTPLASRFDL